MEQELDDHNVAQKVWHPAMESRHGNCVEEVVAATTTTTIKQPLITPGSGARANCRYAFQSLVDVEVCIVTYTPRVGLHARLHVSVVRIK